MVVCVFHFGDFQFGFRFFLHIFFFSTDDFYHEIGLNATMSGTSSQNQRKTSILFEKKNEIFDRI